MNRLIDFAIQVNMKSEGEASYYSTKKHNPAAGIHKIWKKKKTNDQVERIDQKQSVGRQR